MLQSFLVKYVEKARFSCHYPRRFYDKKAHRRLSPSRGIPSFPSAEKSPSDLLSRLRSETGELDRKEKSSINSLKSQEINSSIKTKSNLKRSQALRPIEAGDFIELNFEYGIILENGTRHILDSTRMKNGLLCRFIMGDFDHGVFPSVQKEIMGKKVGDHGQLILSPEDREDDYDHELIETIDRRMLGDVDLEAGQIYEFSFSDGSKGKVKVLRKTDTHYVFDRNDPMSNLDHFFDYTIVKNSGKNIPSDYLLENELTNTFLQTVEEADKKSKDGINESAFMKMMDDFSSLVDTKSEELDQMNMSEQDKEISEKGYQTVGNQRKKSRVKSKGRK